MEAYLCVSGHQQLDVVALGHARRTAGYSANEVSKDDKLLLLILISFIADGRRRLYKNTKRMDE